MPEEEAAREPASSAQGGAGDGPVLQRALSLPLLVLYGLGTTIGAGIYALIGEVSGIAGWHAPLSFLVASLLAGFTAFSFGELASRMPRSAGEAVYVAEGLGWEWLGAAVGLLVALAGGVSAATLTRAFAGYVAASSSLATEIPLLLLIAVLIVLAVRGIRVSALAAGAVTIVSICGLVAVVVSALPNVSVLAERWALLVPPTEAQAWVGILSGAVLAFYAFLGFEDMVNVAEEVKNVRRTLPVAILITLVATTALYGLVALAALASLTPSELARSGAPLVDVFRANAASGAGILLVVSLVSLLNGALVQIIMASRVLYGLSAQGRLPSMLGRVHPKTQTPVYATLLVGVGVTALALWLPLVALAEITSGATLLIFCIVNLALLRLKAKAPSPEGVWVVPRVVPAIGLASSAGLLGFEVLRRLGFLLEA